MTHLQVFQAVTDQEQDRGYIEVQAGIHLVPVPALALAQSQRMSTDAHRCHSINRIWECPSCLCRICRALIAGSAKRLSHRIWCSTQYNGFAQMLRLCLTYG